MNSPSPAPAPDPNATAAAQSQLNKNTAITQYGLNATNQITPNGSLSYKQIGTWPDGTPHFEADTALTPDAQTTNDNLNRTAAAQSGKIGALLDTPVDLSNSATESRLDQLGAARLDPQYAREGQQLETDLLNRGIRPGSDAYNTEHTLFNQSKNDAYNQLYLTGRGQATDEALTQRNQPINEITALLSGSQVSQPRFTNTPTPGVAPTDFIGAQGQSLAQSNVGFNAANQRYLGMQSGLFGLGRTGLTAGMMGGWGGFGGGGGQ